MQFAEATEKQSDGSEIITSWGGYSFAPLERARDITQGRLILIYGTGKAGKTTLAATAIQSEYVSRAAFLACEPGLAVIAHVKAVSYNYEGMDKLVGLIQKMHNTKKGELPFDFICLDNISALVQNRITELGGVNPDWDDYKRETGELIKIIVMLRDIAWKHGIIIVLIAWDDYTIDNSGGSAIKYIHPFVNPALLKLLPGYPDIVGYLERYSGKVRKLTLDPPNNLVQAGIRREPNTPDSEIPDVMYGDPISLVPIINTIIGGQKFDVKYASPNNWRRSSNNTEQAS